MRAYGSDRVRAAGGRVVLHSRIPKGWTPRTPKTLTHAEFPGTAVLWDDEYFEVVSAEALGSGVRYVLEPWREEHTIRTFEPYDEESEVRRTADWERAARQRKYAVVARLAAVVIGHAPAPVQNRVGSELGVFPARMTLISCIPALVLLGTCAWLKTDALLKMKPSPVPVWLWIVAGFFLLESVVRFFVAMSQNRGMGSVLGSIVYLALWLVAPKTRELPSPFTERGDVAFFMVPPPDDVALQDALTVRGPLLTLLTPEEQRGLSERYGFDYRQHSAFALTWSILVVAVVGVVSSIVRLQDGRGLGAFLSLLTAGGLAIEQILRLFALQRGPAGSVLGFFVRPFMRKML